MPDFILAPTIVQVRLSLDPVRNLFNSLNSLNAYETRSGLGDWVAQTVSRMTPQERQHNFIVTALYNAIISADAPNDVSAYLEYLKALDAVAIRDQYLRDLSEEKPDSPAPQTLLTESDVYVTYLKSFYDETSEAFDADNYQHIHRLLQAPEQLKTLVIAHLQTMWDKYVQSEWTHVFPMLQESLLAFQQLDYTDLTIMEAVRAVTGRDLSGYWDTDVDQIKEVVFIPSAHMGPYISRLGKPPIVYIIFGARIPEGVKTDYTDLSRSDLLVQLNALADDTRLNILELLSHHTELCAQDIINMLNLSQSSASRHLRQLSASGYLIERRRDVAKCYSLNFGRVEESALSLRLFLSRK